MHSPVIRNIRQATTAEIARALSVWPVDELRRDMPDITEQQFAELVSVIREHVPGYAA